MLFSNLLGNSCTGSKKIFNSFYYNLLKKMVAIKLISDYKLKRVIIIRIKSMLTWSNTPKPNHAKATNIN